MATGFQGTKVLPLKVGTAATNATAGFTIDRKGYDYCTITVQQSAASATDSADKWAVLKVAEGDSTSAFSDIAAFTGSTATSVTSGFVINANNDTALPAATKIAIDCRNRKRYLQLIVQPDANASTISATAELSRARADGDTTTEQGVITFVAG